MEDVRLGKDQRVRDVLIAYKIMNEEADDWRHATVWRPVRECIKLFHVEDTSFLENMKLVRLKAEEIMLSRNGVGNSQVQHEEEDPVQPVQVDENRPKFKEKKQMTEVEKLKISSKEFDDQNLPRLRSQKNVLNPFFMCSSLSSWNGLPDTSVAAVSGSVGKGVLCGSEMFEENDTYDNYDYDEIIFMI